MTLVFHGSLKYILLPKYSFISLMRTTQLFVSGAVEANIAIFDPAVFLALNSRSVVEI